MNERDIAEQAYKNSYEKGYADASDNCERSLVNNGTGREMRFVGGDVVPVLANQVASKWIPVTERLPNHFGVFIVSVREPYREGLGTDCADFDPFAKRWRPAMCWDSGYEVTHWMPLPEPPKGE